AGARGLTVSERRLGDHQREDHGSYGAAGGAVGLDPDREQRQPDDADRPVLPLDELVESDDEKGGEKGEGGHGGTSFQEGGPRGAGWRDRGDRAVCIRGLPANDV